MMKTRDGRHVHSIRVFALVVIAALTAAGVASGQQAPDQQEAPARPGAISEAESAALALGWTAMANRHYGEAFEHARSAWARFPDSVPVLSLAVESVLADGGALPALDFYEGWQRQSPVEQPGVLRRIARGLLFEWAFRTGDTSARLAALTALRDQGEAAAAEALMTGALKGEVQDVAALAALGHEQALDRLVEYMGAVTGARDNEIRLLAASHNPRAVAPLAQVLADPLPTNRAAAARALGELGSPNALSALQKALKDQHAGVRYEAAGALLKLGDASGRSLLQELAASDSVSARRSAAMLLAADPDPSWMRLVRDLAEESDPLARLDAATLLAPHDPALADAVLDRLQEDDNPAVREAAEEALASIPATDLATLRRLLRSGHGPTAVAAAARLMTLTQQ